MSVRAGSEVACREMFGILGDGEHPGSFLRANILRNWATGMEATPGWRIDRARHISLEDYLFAREVRIRNRNRRHQRLRIRVLGIIV